MTEAERPRRVPLEPREHRRCRRQVSVPIAIDKGETENAPVEPAVAELVLGGDLTRVELALELSGPAGQENLAK